MGLRASFSMDDLGYAPYTSELGIFIDYSDGCEVFASTFERVAKDLVPVDTGYLRSTLRGESFGDGCVCETKCDYAQYVEYGTIRMAAQPYFEPALLAAYNAAEPYWDSAVEEALMEEEELLEEEEEEKANKSTGARVSARGMRGMGGGFGGFLGMIFAAIIVGFIQGLMNVFSDITGGGKSSSRSSIGGDSLKGWGAESIDIEIT